MRILFIHPQSINSPGGGEVWITEVGKRLSSLGHDVGVLYNDYIPYGVSVNNSYVLSKSGVNLYRCGFIALPHIESYRLLPFTNPKCILKTIREYDVTYFIVNPSNALILSVLKKTISKPIVAGFHTTLMPWRFFSHKLYITLFADIFSAFDGLHVLNTSQYEIISRYVKVGEQKIFLIPCGVDVEAFQLCESPWYDNKFAVLFTGRLTYEKGADILVNIIEKINEEFRHISSNIIFIIVGSGPLLHKIKEISLNYKNVIYLGHVPREKLSQFYRKANLLLAPSRFEGMPLAVLEAQACGLPVIGSSVPGIRDLVRNGVTGMLVPANVVEDFCEAIIKMYDLWKNDLQGYRKANIYIRRRIERTYSWSVIIRKVEKMFEALL